MDRTVCGRCAVVVCALASSSFAQMQGTPLVAIGEGQPTSWTDAIMSELLRPVNPAMDGVPGTLRRFFDSQEQTAAFVPSMLTPDLMVPLPGQRGTSEETHQSLLMQWNPLMEGEDVAHAEWQYSLTNIRDPGIDLWNASVWFSLGTPVIPGAGTPIWDVTVSLMDKEGDWATWAQPMPPPGWSMQHINFMVGNQGSWVFFTDAGFDLTNVVAIRVGESGRIGTFPLPPPGAPAGFWDWNAFDSIVIIPTPGAMALLAGAGLLALRRRRGE
jgi:hypothetical protein